MLKFSKRIELSLLALQFMATRNAGEVVSVKEMAENFELSFDFLSKNLQQLQRAGLVQSQQGKRGGYQLAKPASEVSVADVLQAIEGKQALVRCLSEADDCSCEVQENCTIKDPILKIQHKIDEVLASISIAEMAEPVLVTIERT